jgi:hypothetical protein
MFFSVLWFPYGHFPTERLARFDVISGKAFLFNNKLIEGNLLGKNVGNRLKLIHSMAHVFKRERY